jgi:hypothetical protein
MISVISVMNNEVIARDFLLKGLSRQNSKYELLLVDNRKSTYKSASEAYNHTGTKATGDYLMFVHQDAFLLSKTLLRDAEDWLSTLSRVGVAGVVGVTKPKFASQFEICARNYLLHKIDKEYLWFQRYGRGNVFFGSEGKLVPWLGRFISDIELVQTVDDFVLLIPASVFESVKFDEVVCDYWHFYGVDFSLTASRCGYKVCVLPLPVLHQSLGNISKFFPDNLRKMIKKHQQEKILNTTYGIFPTKRELMELFWALNSNKRLVESQLYALKKYGEGLHARN